MECAPQVLVVLVVGNDVVGAWRGLLLGFLIDNILTKIALLVDAAGDFRLDLVLILRDDLVGAADQGQVALVLAVRAELVGRRSTADAVVGLLVRIVV